MVELFEVNGRAPKTRPGSHTPKTRPGPYNPVAATGPLSADERLAGGSHQGQQGMQSPPPLGGGHGEIMGATAGPEGIAPGVDADTSPESRVLSPESPAAWPRD